MKKNELFAFLLILPYFFQDCHRIPKEKYAKGMYGYDASFLKEHSKNVLELMDEKGIARLLLSPEFQGRVMTTTAHGDTGLSFGWMNYELISAQKKKKQFNPVGGEERFWLGPEGGQFALFFKQGDSFNINHWQVPAVIDTIPYDIVSSSRAEAVFSTQTAISNYRGTIFHLTITRTVELLDKAAISLRLKVPIPADLSYVAYETDNQIKNTGDVQWKKENGLLSIWLLGMLTPTDKTIVIVPFHTIARSRNFITDDYFGKVPSDRLLVEDSILYFKCDGKYRSKIGISPLIAGPIVASFDFEKNILNILVVQLDREGLYLNSKWEIQDQPYKGDIVNSYNDGPLPDGSQLGPFYEIESSSSAKELKPGESQFYRQTTCHLQGSYQSLRAVAKSILGIDLEDLKKKPI